MKSKKFKCDYIGNPPEQCQPLPHTKHYEILKIPKANCVVFVLLIELLLKIILN